MALAQEDRGLLARIGFFLSRDGLIPEAETIFNGLAVSAPDKDGAVVGQALCRIIKGESEEAIVLLDERLQRGSPIAPALSLYKLLALGMSGKLAEARALRQSMADQGMAEAVGTADHLLDELSQRKGS